MARVEINFDAFKVKAFLDSNIILECRPLHDLPWEEVDPSGPILALITPTVIKEIDSKKQDGRIGKRAREFNRLIAPVAAGGAPIVIRESMPRVELALASSTRIKWDHFDDLDPDDGDSCIVAEVLHAKDITHSGKVLVSHDIKPIAFASNYDLLTHHVSDNWLRPTEPHPKDRELQKLTQQLAAYRSKEPAFKIEIELVEKEPLTIIQIQNLSNSEKSDILEHIYALNPPVEQAGDSFGLYRTLPSYDHYYEQRYEKYRNKLPRFVDEYELHLERAYNQSRFKVRVVNIGEIQAEHLHIEVNAKNGLINDRFVLISPQGPSRPRPENSIVPLIKNLGSITHPKVGRHEYQYRKEPNIEPSFSVTCEDFRHKQEYSFEGVVILNARQRESLEITVDITASNFHGSAFTSKEVSLNIDSRNIANVIDLTSLRPIIPLPIDNLLSNQDYDSIDMTYFDTD